MDSKPIYVGVKTIMSDLGLSRSKAYMVIKDLNEGMIRAHPNAIVVNGKVNRVWYEEACLRGSKL